MKVDYDANLLIETLFEKVDSAVKYLVADGAPYTPSKLLPIFFKIK